MEYAKIKVLDYEFYIAKNEKGITYIDTENNLEKLFKNVKFKKSKDDFKLVKTQLEEFFLGKRTNFNFKYDLIGTKFSLQVWKLLKDIPYGQTISYSGLAEKLGDVKKTRAVANAVAKNPLLIIIPCHRVIGKNGKLHGFRAGLELKKVLLNIENN